MMMLRTLSLAALALLVPMAPGEARIHGQMYCWIDLEFPIPCEPSDDEEEAAPRGAPPSAGVGTQSVDARSVSLEQKMGASRGDPWRRRRSLRTA
jgi:hypothetical protein